MSTLLLFFAPDEAEGRFSIFPHNFVSLDKHCCRCCLNWLQGDASCLYSFWCFGLLQNLHVLGAKNVDSWNHAYLHANFQCWSQPVHGRSFLINKHNDRVCSGSTQPHFLYWSFKTCFGQHIYGIFYIFGQSTSSDDYLQQGKTVICILRRINPQTAWDNQRKVNTLGTVLQYTIAHLPCYHGRCAWVQLRTPLSTTLFSRSDCWISSCSDI